MAEMKRKRKFAERDSGYGQPFWLSWYSDSDCGGKCISADSLRGDSDFRRFLTTCTRLHPAGVVLASTAGSLLGALVLYGAGTLVSPEGLAELLESRPMKLLGFRAEDAWKTIAWFQKKGQRAVLLGRCIPIIRSLISVPAGMAGMKMPGFLLYTIVGSTVWNLLLVGIGAAVGAAWEQAAEYVKLYADVVFFVLIVGTVCFPAFHLYRKKHRQK